MNNRKTEHRAPARPARYRLMQSAWPAKQAGYDPDWAPGLKCAALDYVQSVRSYEPADHFEAGSAGIMFAKLELWSGAVPHCRNVLLPVRRLNKAGTALLFARHTHRFLTAAIESLDAACIGPVPKLTLDPAHLRWTSSLPGGFGKGRSFYEDVPGLSPQIPAWFRQ